jgi:hypothetical protein
MLSKVGGTRYGVAKNISPVIVRVGGARNADDHLDGVSQALADFMNQKRAGLLQNAVINMSFFFPPTGVNQAWINRLRQLLQDMVNQGMFPITGSGNDGAVSLPLPQHSLSFLTELLVFDYWVSSRIW